MHHSIESLFFGSQFIQPIIHLHDGLHGETNAALRLFQHTPDAVELVFIHEVLEKQVG